MTRHTKTSRQRYRDRVAIDVPDPLEDAVGYGGELIFAVGFGGELIFAVGFGDELAQALPAA